MLNGEDLRPYVSQFRTSRVFKIRPEYLAKASLSLIFSFMPGNKHSHFGITVPSRLVSNIPLL